MTLTDLKQKVNKAVITRDLIEEQRKQLRRDIRNLKKQIEHSEKARAVINAVGKQVQDSLVYHITGICNSALTAVFANDAYQLAMVFNERRNKYECDLFFTRNNAQLSPMDSSGGGTIDIASFALRVTGWSMESPRSQPFIIMDEPFKYLSAEYRPLAAQLLQNLSEQFGIQCIIVTHDTTLTDAAQAVFMVTRKRKYSKIEKQF